MKEKITCPIFQHGDYCTPREKQSQYFPNVPCSWFYDHQPLGDRDETTLKHLVARSTLGYNISEFVFGHSENRPYFLDYIRLDHNDYSICDYFDRKKLKFFKLLPLEAEILQNDITIMVTEKKTVRYRPVHPIFIPVCLTWINFGKLYDWKCEIHVLGTVDQTEETIIDDVEKDDVDTGL